MLNNQIMLRKTIVAVTAMLFVSCSLLAQTPDNTWLDVWQNPSENFYSIKTVFDSSWKAWENEHVFNRTERTAESESEKDGMYFKYRRWEWYNGPRVYPSGDLTLTQQTYRNFSQYLASNPAAAAQHQNSLSRSAQSSGWNFVGPVGAPTGTGAGRINAVRVSPQNPLLMFACAPAGGLWKSTDGGSTWNCLTDFLPVIGCSDVAIDPTNDNILYLATGDNDGGDTQSNGVFKSTDGGLSWNPTGLVFSINQSRKIARLLIDPNNPQILYAGTSTGVFKTFDGGANWYSVSSFSVKDMEFKPGDPNTIYACGTKFYKTTNAGSTWNQITSGLPQPANVARLAIGVTPNDPSYVYILAGQAGTNGFEGVYRSTDSGVSFNVTATSPNLLGWDPNGGDIDGQAWYDLAIAVDPFDKNDVVVGGVNIWRSDDGGQNWFLQAHWYGGGGAPYVHADIHDLVFSSTQQGHLIVGCDGGVFETTNDGASFNDLSATLCIAQIYKLGISASNNNLLITGHQDNGTNLKNGTSYQEVIGGDGMDCFIDRTNNNNMFGELYYGDFFRSTNGGNSFSNITNGLSGTAGWVTPWKQDPQQPGTLLAGYSQMFISTNLGSNWVPLGNQQNFGIIEEFTIAPSNNNYIYLTTGTSVFRTRDRGQNWTNITGMLNTAGASVTAIAVSSYDPEKIWITLSGYVPNQKVYYSEDGGTTWTNVSYGLPNLPANCIISIPGSGNDLVFVGCDVGVYYRSTTSNGWQPYFSGLPYAPVSDIDLFEPTMTLKISTYGRGVWENAIDNNLVAPLANFSSNTQFICAGDVIAFSDLSTYNPATWSWTFPGGTPSSSAAQNPTVTYNTPGIYPVTLTVNNSNGSDAEFKSGYVVVRGAQSLPYSEGFEGSAFLPAGWSFKNNGSPDFWMQNNTIGRNSSKSAFFDNYAVNTPGVKDDMITPLFNLNNFSSASLTFDVAYARYNASRSDTLQVLISADCGQTWTSVFTKGGTQLSTAPDQTTPFAPSSSQWRNESVSLNAFTGQQILIAFRNINRHGQLIYLDNINISGTASSAPVAAFSMQGNACANAAVTFLDNSAPAANSWLWNFQNGNPSASSLQNPSVIWNTPGTYAVTLIVNNALGADTVSSSITVLPAPAANAGSDSTFCSGVYTTLSGSGGVTYSWSPAAGVYNATAQSAQIYLTATRTFTLTVTDANGCSAQDSVTVNINALPGFTVNSSAGSICPGDTVMLTASNASWNYSWSPAMSIIANMNDTIIAVPLVTTTFTAISSDSLGCSGSGARTITVHLNLPTPTVLVNGFNLTCSVTAASYQWYFNGSPITGATSQNYQATQVGMYAVQAFTVQGCESDTSVATLVNTVPELNENSFVIYPNPSSGNFEIILASAMKQDGNIEIFSSDGKLILSEKINASSSSKQIRFENAAPGLYFIRITSGENISASRFIIE
ncbi:MAG: hypothetical protein Fur0041_08770 [Bacteroidia bacterium]